MENSLSVLVSHPSLSAQFLRSGIKGHTLLTGHGASPHIANSRNRNMIAGISSSLIQKANRFSVQRHELALEANVANFGDILLAITPIVLDKDGDGGSGVPMGAVKW